jgi:F-type H+-transporting ATPase subunit b
MQQLFEAFGIDWHLILAQAVNFGVLLIALQYFLYTPVMKALEERKNLVAKGVEDANAATVLLASADESAHKRAHDAEQQAEAIVSLARTEATDERKRIVNEAEARAHAVSLDAAARAKEVAEKMLRESEKEIARIAMLAAEKAIRSQTT